MRPMVLFSGGFDSTYLLLQLAKSGIPVDLHYVELKNNSEKVRMEDAARKEIVKWFNKNYPDFIKSMTSSCMHYQGVSPTLAQPLLWMFGTIPYVHKETSSLLVGYLKGDDASCRYQQIKATWDAVVGLGAQVCLSREQEDFSSNMMEFHFPRSVPLVAPLLEQFMNKVEVLTEFKKTAPDLYDLAVCCELGDQLPDCTCPSCRTHREAIHVIRVREKVARGESMEKLETLHITLDLDGVMNSTADHELIEEIHKESSYYGESSPLSSEDLTNFYDKAAEVGVLHYLSDSEKGNLGDFIQKKLLNNLIYVISHALRVYEDVEIHITSAWIANRELKDVSKFFYDIGLPGCIKISFLGSGGGGDQRCDKVVEFKEGLNCRSDLINIDDLQIDWSRIGDSHIHVNGSRGFDDSAMNLAMNRINRNFKMKRDCHA